MPSPTTLDLVRGELGYLRGDDLLHVAYAVGVSYHTILRVRDDRTDPPFSLVQRLAELFSVETK